MGSITNLYSGRMANADENTGTTPAKIMKLIYYYSPRVHQGIQEKQQQLEQEKTDKEAEKLKKLLTKDD